MKQKIIIFLLGVLLINCQEQKEIKETPSIKIEQKTQTGEHIEKYPNGNIKIKGDLVKGLRQGTWESFYDNGVKWSESTYLFGVRNGTYKIFYPNGRLKIHGAYKNEIKSGIWYFYNENGQFEKEIDFDEKPTNESN